MTTASDLPLKMNHIFVDFENVQQIDLALFASKAVSFTLLVGAKQTKLNVGLVEKMMEHAAAVEMIRLTSGGKNALDFALAYYLGRKVLTDPTAYYHLISKDKGFDPMIEHLRSRHIHAQRHESFATLTLTGAAKETAVAAKAEPAAPESAMNSVLDRLRKNVTNRPKKKKTLLSHLKSQLGKDATDKDAVVILTKLEKGGHVSIGEKDVVTYRV